MDPSSDRLTEVIHDLRVAQMLLMVIVVREMLRRRSKQARPEGSGREIVSY
jgi:hypothetical protein